QRWPSTRSYGSTLASRSTSATRRAQGSAARTRTPTDCCASTSPAAPIYPDTAPTTSRQSRRRSTAAPAKRSVGERLRKCSTYIYRKDNKTLLRRPVECGQYVSLRFRRALPRDRHPPVDGLEGRLLRHRRRRELLRHARERPPPPPLLRHAPRRTHGGLDRPLEAHPT